MGRRLAVLGMLLALLVCADPWSAGAEEHRVAPLADFNRDYYADLAIGVPWDHPGGVSDAGAVNVIHGRDTGLSGWSVQHWHQDSAEIADAAEVNDHFGYSLTVGDFNGDGYFDLASGVPSQSVGGDARAGAVHVLFGGPAGIHGLGDQVWHQDVGTVQSIAEPEDGFGMVVAAGDFDSDGYDDLAVGVPEEDWDLPDSGVVQILYGSPTGLSDIGNQLFRQGFGGLPNLEEEGDRFGSSLAVGDFDHDGYDDLAIGVPYEDFHDPVRVDVGIVHVLYGQPGGLAAGLSLWSQEREGMEDDSDEYDTFGSALTTGDFDGDGYDDLAVGIPGEAYGGLGAGAVHIVRGSSAGLTVTGNRVLNNTMVGNQYHAHFGHALAAADYNGDGFADLAIGVPGYDFELAVDFDCGGVRVHFGSEEGLTSTWGQLLYQSYTWGLGEQPEENDQFGSSLAAGDFDGDGFADLAIGVPLEDITYYDNVITDAGYVHTLYGTVLGLSQANVQGWHQNGGNVADAPGNNERFGYALAAYPGTFHRVFLPLTLRNF